MKDASVLYFWINLWVEKCGLHAFVVTQTRASVHQHLDVKASHALQQDHANILIFDDAKKKLGVLCRLHFLTRRSAR